MNMSRTGGDIGASFGAIVGELYSLVQYGDAPRPYSRPGCWAVRHTAGLFRQHLALFFLESSASMALTRVFLLQLRGWPQYPDMNEVGNFEGDEPRRSDEEQSHWGLWSVVSAPLVLGFDMNQSVVCREAWTCVTLDSTFGARHSEQRC